MDVDIFDNPEKSVDELLTSILEIIPNLNFIDYIYRVPQYNDEPKFFHFICQLKEVSKKTSDGNPRSRDKSGGASLNSEEEAYFKCVAEGIERYYSSTYLQKDLLRKSFNELGEKKAINPKDLVAFSREQLSQKHFEIFNFDEQSKFYWVNGFEINAKTTKKKLIPAQIVYFNYQPKYGERYIRLTISTGTAAGGSISGALLRGIYEIVERDSVMIHYLNRLHGYKVDLSLIKDKSIKQLEEIAEKYRIEINVIDITTDIGIPSFITLLVDKTGIGCSLVVGLKSNLDPYKAIVDSFEESLHTIGWMREFNEYKNEERKGISPQEITKSEDRGMYWYNKSKLKFLDFWLKQKPQKLKEYRKYKDYKSNSMLKEVLKILENKNLKTYFVDLTPQYLKNIGIHITKTIIPKLYPFYVDETYKYLGVKRLYNVPLLLGYKVDGFINDIPHPII